MLDSMKAVPKVLHLLKNVASFKVCIGFFGFDTFFFIVSQKLCCQSFYLALLSALLATRFLEVAYTIYNLLKTYFLFI
jgi:hypothetical protein